MCVCVRTRVQLKAPVGAVQSVNVAKCTEVAVLAAEGKLHEDDVSTCTTPRSLLRHHPTSHYPGPLTFGTDTTAMFTCVRVHVPSLAVQWIMEINGESAANFRDTRERLRRQKEQSFPMVRPHAECKDV